MTALPPWTASALEYRERWGSGAFDAVTGMQTFLSRLEEVDARVAGLLERFDESALADAAAADRRRAAGEPLGRLEGIPFTAKANLCTTLGHTTAGSRILAGYRSPYEATAVARLRAAGAILVGKTNLDEFAMGSSCENSAWHPTRNPWDLERVPGGSSGGAAALAGSLGWSFHIGSDTGGSIRQPASYCGVTGMKPTYGFVSRFGLLAFGSTLDQVGPLTRRATDARAVLAVMAGEDPLDATTIRVDGDLASPVAAPTRIGLPREYFDAVRDSDVLRCTREAIRTLEEAGVASEEVSLPHNEVANACYQIVCTAEASSNLARYDGIHYGVRQQPEHGDLQATYLTSRGRGFGPEVQRRILLGTFVLSAGYSEAYYQQALRVRRKIRDDFDRAFERVEVLVCPTSPIAPFALGEKVTDPLALYACDALTVAASLAGLPAISIPCGRDAAGLPVGLQILGPAGRDDAVLALAERFQELTDHDRALPDLDAENGGEEAGRGV